jgi:hypothetical protein
VRSVLSLVLDDAVDRPIGRLVVGIEPTDAMEIVVGHRSRPLQDERTNARESIDVCFEILAIGSRQMAVALAIGPRQQALDLERGVSQLEDLVDDPIRLDQGDVIEQRADAVAPDGSRSAWMRRAAASAPRMTRRMLPPSDSVAQKGEDGEDSPVVLGSRDQLQLREDRSDVALDGPWIHGQAVGNRGIGSTLGHQPQDVALAARELVEWRVAASPSQEASDHRRVDDRLTAGDPPNSIRELGDPRHPLLQEIADPRGVVAQEVDGIPGLDVLGKHQDRGARVRGANLAGRFEALGRVRRWHPDIHDDNIRVLTRDEREQLCSIGRLADDLEPGSCERRRQRFAEEDRIVCEGDPDHLTRREAGVFHGWHAVGSHPKGSSARTVVPIPGGLVTVSRPPIVATRSLRPRSPEPRSGSASPRPSSLMVTASS